MRAFSASSRNVSVIELRQSPLPGLRADVDAREAGVVVLGGERIEAEADFRDLRLRRQAPALEAVDAQARAGAGHLLEHLRHFVRVVRQLLDLLLRELRRERVVQRLLGVVARDVDLLDERRDHQRDLLVGVAAADVLLEVLRVESDRFDVDRVFAGRQVLEDRLAALAGLDGAIDALLAPDAHRRIDDRRARLVDHGDAQRADIAPRIRRRGLPALVCGAPVCVAVVCAADGCCASADAGVAGAAAGAGDSGDESGAGCACAAPLVTSSAGSTIAASENLKTQRDMCNTSIERERPF